MQVFTFSQRITDLEGTVVRQTDDISCPGLIDRSLPLSHELSR